MKEEFWKGNEDQFNKSFEEAFDSEMKNINEQLDKEILFTMVGNVNSGKSSTINLLMGYEATKIGAKPGETIKIDEYKYMDKIVFADTPGLHDIIEENSEKTLDYYKKADVILFFLNAAGEVLSSPEKKVFDKVKKYNDNIIIVLNKIDAAEDIQNLIEYVGEHTGRRYPIIPISSKTGDNINGLKEKILDLLQHKKKDLLFAKSVKDKSTIANKWILSASTSAGAIGLSPLPGSDIIPITVIQVGLLLKLSHLYNRPISKKKAKEMILSTITGNVGRTVFRQLVKLFPGYGLIIGGGVAGSLTFALGQAVKYALENGIELDAASLKNLYDMFAKGETQA